MCFSLDPGDVIPEAALALALPMHSPFPCLILFSSDKWESKELLSQRHWAVQCLESGMKLGERKPEMSSQPSPVIGCFIFNKLVEA